MMGRCLEELSYPFSCLLGIIPDGNVGKPEDGLRAGGAAGVEVWTCLTWKNVQISDTHLHSCLISCHFSWLQFSLFCPPSSCPSTFIPPTFAIQETSPALKSELFFLVPVYSHKSFKR